MSPFQSITKNPGEPTSQHSLRVVQPQYIPAARRTGGNHTRRQRLIRHGGLEARDGRCERGVEFLEDRVDVLVERGVGDYG